MANQDLLPDGIHWGRNEETGDSLSANKSADIRGIEKKIYEYGTRLLEENGIFGCTLLVKVTPNRASSPSIPEDVIEAKRAAKAARRAAVMEKLMTVDDAGIRQQLALLSLDAQDVYHILRDRAIGGNVAVTADSITGVDGVSISKRSVENALKELREASLIRSIGSKKKPVIHLTESMIPSNAAECQLYKAARSKKEISRMQSICGQCTLSCPVHNTQ